VKEMLNRRAPTHERARIWPDREARGSYTVPFASASYTYEIRFG